MIIHYAVIVKLHVKRRRWTDKSSGETLQRDWHLVTEGTFMAKDFAGFLKKLADTKAIQIINRFNVRFSYFGKLFNWSIIY